MFSLKKWEIHDACWSRVWKLCSAVWKCAHPCSKPFKAQRAAWCYARVLWEDDSCTHPFVTAQYVWQMAHHWSPRSVRPAPQLPCPTSLARQGTHCELSRGDPSLQLALRILLRDLLPYTEITRQTREAREHLGQVDGCRAGGSSAEGRRPGGTGPGIPRFCESVQVTLLTLGLLTIKASIEAPVLGGRKEWVWERQESTNTSVCNVYVS